MSALVPLASYLPSHAELGGNLGPADTEADCGIY
jgi:hypothetical protein